MGWGWGGGLGSAGLGAQLCPTQSSGKGREQKETGRVSRSIPAPSVGFLFFLRQLSIDASYFWKRF